MPIIQTARKHSAAFFTGLGVLGGVVLVITKLLTTRGPIVLIPYAAIVVSCAAFIRFADEQTFGRRFLLSLYAFMTATVIFYVYVAAIDAQTLFTISAVGHAARIGLMLVIGMVISTVIALSGAAPARDVAA
jgi:hypothetical protein